ncbi:hypothetical protein COT97_00375 [Candidatus Falkowbacteria bacterium CG10_big_fil_rev_8_21_14_0_10_39_11]|uniref:Uncharacterized protein n=1 Tax=Candidatus Falkowbacteria bacterium CG10_big_fil_rev_8_21_14_0_10_39_11 TaxID=1974565 RepID=A0A2H0V696_9BACT|nr:MAG: hypothetical protein COT97_00375 [Candidatus Falkowbacteria bacterium CG10_big_fil_rev_8_21_14_0_10_39_11]
MSIFERIFNSKKLFRNFIIVVVVLFVLNLILTIILVVKVVTVQKSIDTYQAKEAQILNQIYGRTWTIQGSLEGKNTQ